MDRETKREIILDNYEHPFNKGKIADDTYIEVNTKSDSCIDNITMHIKIEKDIIKDIVFDGEACAICTSATSILIKNLIGKNISEVRKIVDNFKSMLKEEEYDESILNELIVYSDIYLQPSRVNCCLLPFKCIDKVIDKEDKYDN